MALYKCPSCNSERVLFANWFTDGEGLVNEAVYCKSCFSLSTFVGSLNPFTGFRKHVGTYPRSMISLDKNELGELSLPSAINDSIIDDKKRVKD